MTGKRQARKGDTVNVNYMGRLEDNTIFDRTEDGHPSEFQIGNNSMIQGFEEAVVGMTVGEVKKVIIPPEEAYGDYRNDLKEKIKRSAFPAHITPVVGKKIQVKEADGTYSFIQIIEVEEDTVTIDSNHPLAGQTLTYEIELVSIN